VLRAFKDLCLHVSVLFRTHFGESAVGKFLFRNVKFRLIVGIKFCIF
jgi:hypothetical protein